MNKDEGCCLYIYAEVWFTVPILWDNNLLVFSSQGLMFMFHVDINIVTAGCLQQSLEQQNQFDYSKQPMMIT